MELDAASNGGIASVRKIKDISMYTPSMLKHRVFVLDEAHAMSREAFQAMLKILEEPPPRTIFIMATTEVQEIPETILSRAFPFEFKRIQPVDIAGRLRMIADCESLDVEDSALMAIAANVSGAVRDAITLLQQVSALPGRVTEDDVLAVLGVLKRSEIADAVEFMINKKAARVVIWLGQLRTKGVSPFVVLEALLDYSNVLLASSVGVSSGLSVAEQDRAYLLCQQLGPERLDRLVEHISTISVRASRAQRFAQLLVDTGLTRIAREGAL
jgi:DNA polymerase-3 subunit gamma/tau